MKMTTLITLIAIILAVPFTVGSALATELEFVNVTDFIVTTGLQVFEDGGANMVVNYYDGTQCNWNQFDPETYLNISSNHDWSGADQAPDCSSVPIYAGHYSTSSKFSYITTLGAVDNITTWNTGSFTFDLNEFGEGATCPIYDDGDNFIMLSTHAIMLDSGTDSLTTCKISPRTLLGTHNAAQIDVGQDWEFAREIDYSNRFMLTNATHFTVRTWSDDMNLSKNKVCENTLPFGGSWGADIGSVETDNGWIYFVYKNDRQFISVYSGYDCSLGETIILPTLGCGSSILSKELLVNTDGIHCVDSTDTSRLIKYTADWLYPLAEPVPGVSPTCEYPCIFNDTFSYFGSLCSQGWDSPSGSCGSLNANGTHFLCEDRFGMTLYRSFSPLTEVDGYIYLDFDLNKLDGDGSSSWWKFYDSEWNTPITIMFDGYSRTIKLNQYSTAGGFEFGYTENQSNQYSMRIDLSSQSVLLTTSEADTVTVGFNSEADNIRGLYIDTDLAYVGCNFAMDYVVLRATTSEAGAPGAPGGPIVDTDTNHSQGSYIGGVLMLDMVDADFNYTRAVEKGYCSANDGVNECFFKVIARQGSTTFVNLLTDNWLVVIGLVVFLLVVGLAVKALGG